MKLVLEFGAEHPSLRDILPPSPNSSSDSLRRQEAIIQLHKDFQSARPVVVGPRQPDEQVEQEVHPGFGPPEPEIVEPDAVPVEGLEPEPVDGPDVDGVVESGDDDVINDGPAPTGPRTHSSISSSDSSLVFPADNPAPKTVAGGYNSLDVFIEFGAVRVNPATANWYKFSALPTDFKLVVGADGREFLFCLPDADNVEVTHVEGTGQRDVSFQVRPDTKNFESQTEPGTPPGTPPSSESGSTSNHDSGSAPGDGSAPASVGDTTAATSVATDTEEKQESLASAELTK